MKKSELEVTLDDGVAERSDLENTYEKYDQITPLPWYQSIFMNWFDFDQTVAKVASSTVLISDSHSPADVSQPK